MRTVNIKLLPDGSGRVRIHWFQRLDNGPARTPEGAVMSTLGPLRSGGVRGRIACQPNLKDVGPQQVNGETVPICHSDDVRGATCPECLATAEAKAALADYALTLNTAG